MQRKNIINVKIIANYLPQYHKIPENDMWWGEGFTDWVAAKKGKPLFDGHRQPRVPLNNNYYDLSNAETIRWQAQLAKRYGVYGFGIYHYWFNSDLQLLQKPAELLLQNEDIDIHFMFLWDNISWVRTWGNIAGNDWIVEEKGDNDIKNAVLAELEYGEENDWKAHFDYLLPFFRDERYIKLDGKPMFGFMKPRNNPQVLENIARYWNCLAEKNGFSGIVCMAMDDWQQKCLEYRFKCLPMQHKNLLQALYWKLKYYTSRHDPLTYDYDELWKKLLNNACDANFKTFLSGFVDYDDTPRRGKRGSVVLGATPQKFQKYFTELLKISKRQGKEYVFCPAWNEWGEGDYLEPDTVNGYAYLEALKAAVDEVNGK